MTHTVRHDRRITTAGSVLIASLDAPIHADQTPDAASGAVTATPRR